MGHANCKEYSLPNISFSTILSTLNPNENAYLARDVVESYITVSLCTLLNVLQQRVKNELAHESSCQPVIQLKLVGIPEDDAECRIRAPASGSVKNVSQRKAHLSTASPTEAHEVGYTFHVTRPQGLKTENCPACEEEAEH